MGHRPRKRKSRSFFEDLGLEDILDDAFESVGDAFDSVGDIFDTIGDSLDESMDELDERLEASSRKLDDEMAQLDRKMEKLDKDIRTKSKARKHKFSFTDTRGNKITVRHNGTTDNVQIESDGDFDMGTMEEVHAQIRERMSPKQKRVRDWPPPPGVEDYVPERGKYALEPRPAFYKRTWRGDSGDPLECTADSRVTVAGGGMFGRKYTVEVDGTTVYMLGLERIMEENCTEILTEFFRSWSDGERAVMVKILTGLDKVGIAESHHHEAKAILSGGSTT